MTAPITNQNSGLYSLKQALPKL